MNALMIKFKGTLNDNLGFVEPAKTDDSFIIPKPNWLIEGEWTSYKWVIKDRASEETINFEIILSDGSYLTDDKNKSSLDAIKIAIILSRNGSPSVQYTESAKTQYKLAMNLVNYFSYVVLRGLDYFSDMSEAHMDAMVDSFAYGVPEALEYSSRFIAAAHKIKNEKNELPLKFGELDAARICKSAGFELKSWRNDVRGHNVRLHIAKENNIKVGSKFQDIIPDVEKYEVKVNSKDTLRKTYKAIHFLWQIKEILEDFGVDYIEHNPFRDMSYDDKAKSLGETGKRTPTMPEPIALHMIDRSLRWVVDYGDELLDLRDAAENTYVSLSETYKDNYPSKLTVKFLSEYEPRETGEGDPWPINGFSKTMTKSKDLTLYQAVNGFLPLACMIVILAFTARRKIEVESATEECVYEKDNELWMDLYIAKTLRENDSFPTVAVVEKAVTLLERWSEKARKLTGIKNLFQVKALNNDTVSSFLWKEWIKDFAEYVEVPDCDSGEKWSFSQHQFRRFFAMMYFWRYDIKGLQYLSDHLRHFDFEMTIKYVTEIIPGQVFNEQTKRRVRSYFDSIANGDDKLIGLMSERMSKDYEKLNTVINRRLRTGRKDALNKWIDRHIDKVGYVLNFLPWGMCFGETPRLKRKCLCLSGDNGVIDLDEADVNECKCCPNFASHAHILNEYQENYKDNTTSKADIDVCNSVILDAVLKRKSVCMQGE